jgi:L-lactate dehydrogenase complex protein LldG
MIERFIEKARIAGAEVERVADVRAAAAFIQDFLKKNDLRTALISPDLKLRPPFDREFAGTGTTLGGDSIWVDAGIVAADHGVAETGTLVHFDRSDTEKNVWTLPEVCICLLEARAVTASLDDLAQAFAAHLGRTDIPSPQVSLVTGPSRTADIEGQLTIGVHGPSRLIVLLT